MTKLMLLTSEDEWEQFATRKELLKFYIKLSKYLMKQGRIMDKQEIDERIVRSKTISDKDYLKIAEDEKRWRKRADQQQDSRWSFYEKED